MSICIYENLRNDKIEKLNFVTGYLIVVPYSFALPTFNLQTSRRKRKSITLEKELLANLTADEIFPSDSYDEPAYGVELNKMSLYFSVLGVTRNFHF